MAALAPLARVLAAAQSPGGVGMFERACYTGGAITHYISSGQISAEFDVLLTDANALFAAAGGAATLAQCQDLISTSIVRDCDVECPKATIASLNLTI
jgi:hypothetical protein